MDQMQTYTAQITKDVADLQESDNNDDLVRAGRILVGTLKTMRGMQHAATIVQDMCDALAKGRGPIGK